MSKQPNASQTLPGLEAFGVSPLRRQYLEQKRAHPDALLLFRLGDFYEMFDGDAELAARTLNIVLTARDVGRGERVPMAGIPHHSADGYIARLIAAGIRIAVCEQTTEPNGRDLVERKVVRVITPGTVEDGFLPTGANNYLAALVRDGQGAGLAFVDVTTGELAATEVRGADWDAALRAELARLAPAECLVPEALELPLADGIGLCTERPAFAFGATRAAARLTRQFGSATLHGLGLAEAPLAVCALGALLEYVEETHAAALRGLAPPQLYDASGRMLVDTTARQGLELGSRKDRGGLLGVLDRTLTPMGGRLLAGWVSQPLTDLAALRARQDAVAALVEGPLLRARLRSALTGIADLERLANRASQRLSGPRDLAALARTLRRVPAATELLLSASDALAALLTLIGGPPDPCSEIATDIENTLADEPPAAVGEGVIRQGIAAELDELRSLSGDARQWLVTLEKAERERTGAKGLKVGFNKVFGYYLECSTAQLGQPTDYYQRQQTNATTLGEHLSALGYLRKQTLTTAERFVTQALKEHERKVEQAHDRSVALEQALYDDLLHRIAVELPRAARSARMLATLDALAALAEVAAAHGYVRPALDESCDLVLRGVRHPVVERLLPAGSFVPNDVEFEADGMRAMVLTGPNMAGKSTFGKSVLLLVLMAQIGSYVPADEARIGVVDRVFVRAGSGEDLAGGRSTFMVEMEETAGFLHHATERSLAFLDEVGRGTSTFDGMALARAILEYAVQPPGPRCRLIFSTHYHELSALDAEFPEVRSHRMDVREDGERAVFLYRAVPGGADRSYGVHVARLAGIPEPVTRRAAQLLRELESAPAAQVSAAGDGGAPCVSHSALHGDPLRDELRGLPIEQLTPVQALVALDRLRAIALASPHA